MKTIEIKVYKYEELEPEAKEKAFNHYLEHFDYPWQHENQDSLDAFVRHFDILFRDYAYDGSVKFTMDEQVKDLQGVRLWKYLKNNNLDKIFKGNYPTLITTPCPFTGFHMDDALLEPMLSFLKCPDKNTTFEELVSDCFHSYTTTCQEDIDGMCTEEYFAEDVETNDYPFLEDGTIYYG